MQVLIYILCVCELICAGVSELSLLHNALKYQLSYDVASGSEITLCNKINKSLVVYIFDPFLRRIAKSTFEMTIFQLQPFLK